MEEVNVDGAMTSKQVMSKATDRKYFTPVLSIMLALLTAMAPFAIDTYLAAIPEMAVFFNVGIHLIELTLALYFFGFAIGNFVGGPASDVYGRKTVALTGVLLYGISAVLISWSTHIYFVYVLRVIQAFGGGLASVTTMVFVRDLYSGRKVARMATIVGMISMLAPMFAPVVGGFLVAFGGWQVVFYFLTGYAIFVFTAFYFIVPESRDRKLISNSLKDLRLIEKYKMLFFDVKSVFMLFSIGFSVAGMLSFVTNASFIYLAYFGFDKSMFPYLFGANLVLNVILSLLNTWLLKKYSPADLLGVAIKIQFLAGISILCSVLFGSSSFEVVFASIVLYVGCLGLVFGNGTALVLNSLPENSGSANAMIGVVRFLLGFLAGFLLTIFHTGNIKPFGVLLFMCALLSNLFFYLYKKKDGV